jgi:ribosomal protein S18 acetylase RimI-like enzyme
VITIRPASGADVPVLREIAMAAYERYVPIIGRAPAPMTADYATAVQAGQAWLAAGADGAALGLIVLIRHPGFLLLENVAVAPAAQGRGVGARLLAFAEEQARALGLAEIRLYTNEAMTANLAYYPRHGYTETHRAQEDGFRRVFFAKQLGGQAGTFGP